MGWRIEASGGPWFGQLADKISTFDAESVRRAFRHAVDMYVDLRTHDPPHHPTPRIPDAIFDLDARA